MYYLYTNSVIHLYRTSVSQHLTLGKCLCGRILLTRNIYVYNIIFIYTSILYTWVKKCLFQTHDQSPSAMTRNNYLIFVLIGWLPGCGYTAYIRMRWKRNNITLVCVCVCVQTPKGYHGPVSGVSGWQDAWSMTITPARPAHKTPSPLSVLCMLSLFPYTIVP